MSPHVFFQGFVLFHAGEEIALALPFALLAGAFALMSWAGRRDKADPPDQDEQFTEEHIA